MNSALYRLLRGRTGKEHLGRLVKDSLSLYLSLSAPSLSLQKNVWRGSAVPQAGRVLLAWLFSDSLYARKFSRRPSFLLLLLSDAICCLDFYKERERRQKSRSVIAPIIPGVIWRYTIVTRQGEMII